MGPVIIFDKSTLESLNPDEAVWLDQFFLTNITPLFFVETLADLQKNVRSDRTPEDIVGSLAYRTPDLHSKANVHHRTLLEGELAGEEQIEMDGRPIIGGGRYVELGGQTGAYFEASPEEEAMQRWRDHKFLELERLYAKQWREGLSNVDLEEIYSHYREDVRSRASHILHSLCYLLRGCGDLSASQESVKGVALPPPFFIIRIEFGSQFSQNLV